MSSEARYVPAAGRRALTRLYDPVLALTTRERRFRALLRDQVLRHLPVGGTAIDVGCGTGTFAIAIAAARPDAQVIGVDGDAQVLARAQRKAGAAAVTWRSGLAGELPADDASADALVMSLLLHHLDPAGKRQALHEAIRVLRPGGRLHIADWDDHTTGSCAARSCCCRPSTGSRTRATTPPGGSPRSSPAPACET